MATPQEIKVRTGHTLDVDYTYFDDIRRAMDEIAKSYPMYERFYVQMEGEAYSDREYPHIYGIRMETMDEAEAREAKARVAKDDRVAREKAEFQRLSKLYGGQ